MNILPILKRSIKWRVYNAFTIVITILQPMLWLLLYSTCASQSMKNSGIENYSAFILPGLIVLVCFSASSSGGIMNYLMKADKSFYRILIAPINRSSIVIGSLLEAVLCSFLEVFIMFFVGMFLSVRISSGLMGCLLIILITFLTAFFMSGFCYAISLCLPNEVIYETVMNAIVLPIFFLSTALFPTDAIEGKLSIAVNLNPFTHVINAVRDIIMYDNIQTDTIFKVLLLLLIMGVISFYLPLIN